MIPPYINNQYLTKKARSLSSSTNSPTSTTRTSATCPGWSTSSSSTSDFSTNSTLPPPSSTKSSASSTPSKTTTFRSTLSWCTEKSPLFATCTCSTNWCRSILRALTWVTGRESRSMSTGWPGSSRSIGKSAQWFSRLWGNGTLRFMWPRWIN